MTQTAKHNLVETIKTKHILKHPQRWRLTVAVVRKQGMVLLGAVQDTDPADDRWVWSSSAMTTSGPRLAASHESLARMSWWEWLV